MTENEICVTTVCTYRLVFTSHTWKGQSGDNYKYFFFQLISSCKSAWSRIQYLKKQNKVCLMMHEYVIKYIEWYDLLHSEWIKTYHR